MRTIRDIPNGTLTYRISKAITLDIADGTLNPGDPLPTTNKLAAHYGVSRHTVLAAYTILGNLIERRQGKCVYIAKRPDNTGGETLQQQLDALNERLRQVEAKLADLGRAEHTPMAEKFETMRRQVASGPPHCTALHCTCSDIT